MGGVVAVVKPMWQSVWGLKLDPEQIRVSVAGKRACTSYIEFNDGASRRKAGTSQLSMNVESRLCRIRGKPALYAKPALNAAWTLSSGGVAVILNAHRAPYPAPELIAMCLTALNSHKSSRGAQDAATGSKFILRQLIRIRFTYFGLFIIESGTQTENEEEMLSRDTFRTKTFAESNRFTEACRQAERCD